jgi:hypothetical protein
LERENLLGGSAFLLRGFMSPQECEAHVDLSEDLGYEEAPINMGAASVVVKDYRNNSRVISDDPDLAGELLERLRLQLPETLDGRRLCGLNERFRYYRYDLQESFAPHYDGPFIRSPDEASALTLMIYLNDDFEGGTTDFYHEDQTLRLQVVPEQGMALVFRHQLLHAGTSVRDGRKYVLRTDVMYRAQRFTL